MEDIIIIKLLLVKFAITVITVNLSFVLHRHYYFAKIIIYTCQDHLNLSCFILNFTEDSFIKNFIELIKAVIIVNKVNNYYDKRCIVQLFIIKFSFKVNL